VSALKYDHYADLAGLFDFPDADYLARARQLLALLGERCPEAAAELQLFLDVVPHSADALQELYTRTFEIQSLTTLAVGYILFGDDYKRGDLLANLNREHGLVGNDCRGELADHLPNMLRLIPLLKDEELRQELVAELLLPAVALMIREFDTERVATKDKNYQKHYKTLIEAPIAEKTIYCRAFKALLQVFSKDFHTAAAGGILTDIIARYQSSDFLGMITREMEVEATANSNNSGCDH
jgi:nitrate reductase assembly molybdenum cofactor insertion protein NarJ